jgi:predicted metalloprotease with PDZ domain
MFKFHFYFKRPSFFLSLLLSCIICFLLLEGANAQKAKPVLKYSVSMPRHSLHYFHVKLVCDGWGSDTLVLKMPQWMPGYYQIMNYADAVENFSVQNAAGEKIDVNKIDNHTRQIVFNKRAQLVISYDVKTDKQFVANSFVDSSHGYIIPAGVFFYIEGHLDIPVTIHVLMPESWNKMATGLKPVAGKANEFVAPDFDILYDCPILMGNLEELPSFKVNGIEHRFIGYRLGDFDRLLFMSNLKKMVEAAVAIIGDIPYKQYTFIGIGPGRGGIEHLNNTTVGFDGKDLNTAGGFNRMMSFLAHEYFHNYNVKRIRPVELGPFDYEKENRTNLLWVSEGLSVYYEYMIIKRAGLINEQMLLSDFEKSINAFENNPGRLYQSLVQASYETWSDGPFGKQGEDAKKSISYYDKGPAVGLLLDFAIHHATQNKKSLDDVMRLLYWQYYKKLQRGFTDAEFQQACETVAGISLSPLFEYVYTTKELDYNKYLAYAGLTTHTENNGQKIFIKRMENPDALQSAILESWLNGANTR